MVGLAAGVAGEVEVADSDEDPVEVADEVVVADEEVGRSNVTGIKFRSVALREPVAVVVLPFGLSMAEHMAAVCFEL